MTKKVAVILSGCGHRDGSEIHEATFVLFALDKRGVEYKCYAPDKNQPIVRNHTSGKTQNEQRNALVESARISRGNIEPIKNLKASDYDALIFPGGQGAGITLCTFLNDGPNCTIDPEIKNIVLEFNKNKKPIGAVCISPALIAAIFKESNINPTLTLGENIEMNEALKEMNAMPINCTPNNFVSDEKNKIVSTPAYMEAKTISEIWLGIDGMVEEVLRLTT